MREIEGPRSNERIIEYLRSTSYPDALIDANGDSIAWCASFVNWCLAAVGIAGTGKANARSYLGYGEHMDIEYARPGDIAVFERPPNPASGHVAFFERLQGKSVFVTGGNQKNRVCMAPYPRNRLIAVRRPVVG